MVIVKSIGAFFVRIWRWIKETAWVQPLLIVGAVFAIIFSIPSLTSLVDSWAGSGDGTFYERYSRSLEGEVLFSDGDTYMTAADTITADLAAAIDDLGDESAIQNIRDTYGEKFFFSYVGSDCDACLDDEGGFERLEEYWNEYYIPSDGRDFNFYTIDSDQTSTNDDDYENRDWDTAFRRYLLNYGDDFFQPLADLLYNTTYYWSNLDLDEDDFQIFGDAAISGEDTFTVPVTILFDFSEEAVEAGRVCEAVLTSLTGSNDSTKSYFLMNMWNHLDSDRSNPFSSDYWSEATSSSDTTDDDTDEE